MRISVYKIKYGVAHYLIVNKHLSQKKEKGIMCFFGGGGGDVSYHNFEK